MKATGRDEITSPGSRFLRAAARVVVAGGAIGSLVLLFQASQSRPPLLMALFVIWVLSPFMALLGTHAFSNRWSALARATCHGIMIVLPLASLAIYANDALRPRRAQAAFVYIAVPLASWLLIAIVIPMAMFISGRQSRRGDGD